MSIFENESATAVNGWHREAHVVYAHIDENTAGHR